MADKYRKIEKAQETLPPNEIRVKGGVGIGRYLKRAHELLSQTEDNNETVVIKGVSNAVESAVKLAELIKHRIKGLHQCNRISHITIVDEYEPLEEGLDHLEFTRIVTMLQITLSKRELDQNDYGYQAPIDASEVQEYVEKQEGEGAEGEERKRRPRRNGRRPRGRGGRDFAEGETRRPRRPRGEGKEGEEKPRRPRKPRGEKPDEEETPGEERKEGERPRRQRKPRRPRADGEEGSDRPAQKKDDGQYHGGQASRKPKGDNEYDAAYSKPRGDRPPRQRDGERERREPREPREHREGKPRYSDAERRPRNNDERPRRGGDGERRGRGGPDGERRGRGGPRPYGGDRDREDRPRRPRGSKPGYESRGPPRD